MTKTIKNSELQQSFLPAVKEQKRELRKAVEAIHVSSSLGLLQKKMLNNLVFYAYGELLTAEVHHCSVSQLAKDVGFDSNNIPFLVNSLKAIQQVFFDFDILNNVVSPDGWRRSICLAEVAVDNGIVSYSFPPSLRKQFHNPKVFSIINLQIQKKFKSVYAYTLYENVSRFKNTGSTGYISVENWKKLLGVGANSETYDDFKQLNAQIIKPAINEISKVTGLILEPDYKRLGRKIDMIKFQLIHAEEISVQSDEEVKIELLRRILALGIQEKTAHKYINAHPLDYIDGNLSVVEGRIKSGKYKIINYPLYFKNALEEDFRPIKPTIDKEIEDAKITTKVEIKPIDEDLLRLKKQRLLDANQYFESMSAGDKKEIETLFAQYAEASNSALFKSYCKVGLSGSTIVRKSFSEWLAKKIETGQ